VGETRRLFWSDNSSQKDLTIGTHQTKLRIPTISFFIRWNKSLIFQGPFGKSQWSLWYKRHPESSLPFPSYLIWEVKTWGVVRAESDACLTCGHWCLRRKHLKTGPRVLKVCVCPHKNLHTTVHSIIYNTKKVETIQMSTNWRMEKTVVYIHTMEYHSDIKGMKYWGMRWHGWTSKTCKAKGAGIKGHISYNAIYMKCPE
jgi:hypothetical protein